MKRALRTTTTTTNYALYRIDNDKCVNVINEARLPLLMKIKFALQSVWKCVQNNPMIFQRLIMSLAKERLWFYALPSTKFSVLAAISLFESWNESVPKIVCFDYCAIKHIIIMSNVVFECVCVCVRCLYIFLFCYYDITKCMKHNKYQ